jgi:hypothetical protein
VASRRNGGVGAGTENADETAPMGGPILVVALMMCSTWSMTPDSSLRRGIGCRGTRAVAAGVDGIAPRAVTPDRV